VYWITTYDSDSYIKDTNSLVLFGWPYRNDFWTYAWGYDHIGGYTSMIIAGDDRYCSFFFSANAGSNFYKIGWTRLDLGFV